MHWIASLDRWLEWLFLGRKAFQESVARIQKLESEAQQARAELADLKALLFDLNSELNQLRNNMPPIQATPESGARIKRLGSWRATVAAIEGKPIPGTPQPIPIERTA